MPKIDFKTINEHALNQAQSVVSHWVSKGKRNGNEWVGINPTRNDSGTGSFSINLTTGVWKDFATEDGVNNNSKVIHSNKVKLIH